MYVNKYGENLALSNSGMSNMVGISQGNTASHAFNSRPARYNPAAYGYSSVKNNASQINSFSNNISTAEVNNLNDLEQEVMRIRSSGRSSGIPVPIRYVNDEDIRVSQKSSREQLKMAKVNFINH